MVDTAYGSAISTRTAFVTCNGDTGNIKQATISLRTVYTSTQAEAKKEKRHITLSEAKSWYITRGTPFI